MKYNELTEEQKSKLDSVGTSLRSEFSTNEVLRLNKEKEWLEDLRSTEGIYDPEVDKAIPANASRVFPKYTRAKEVTLRARLNNIILPDFEKNWTLKPTPKPKLHQDVLDEIYTTLDTLNKQKALEATNQSGKAVPPEKVTQEQFEKYVYEYSSARCKLMENEIEDQLIELGYEEVVKRQVHSTVRYGTGVVEGVFSKKVINNGYEENLSKFVNVHVEKHLPDVGFCRIWDFYPDMTAQEPEDCEFAWKRHVFPKHKMYKLAKRDDFFSEVIKDYLHDHPNGDATYKPWELLLETISDENAKTRTNKYEVLSRWGTVSGRDLFDMGLKVDEKDIDEDFWCNIWLLGNRVIKAILSPLAGDITLPYHIFYFDKNESSIFGRGLPRILRDTQFIIGGSIREALNNAAACSGTQLDVNIDLLDPGEDPQDAHPRRVWLRHGRQSEAQHPAVRPINFESHVVELLQIFDKAMQIGDMEISVPMFMTSDRDQNATRKSTAEIANKWAATTLPIKDIIKNYDSCNEGIIKAFVAWNMEYNPNDAIKGDFDAQAKGSVSLLTRELKMQAINIFAQTLTPDERVYFKTGLFLAERAKAFDIDPKDILYTEEEVQVIRQSMRDQEAEQLQKDELRAKIQERIARAKGIDIKSNVAAKQSDLNIIDNLVPKPEQNTGLTGGQ